MTDKQYHWIQFYLTTIAILSALVFEYAGIWQLFVGVVGLQAAVVAVVLRFMHTREPQQTAESVLPELIHGLQGGAVVLKKTVHVVVTNELIKQDGHTCQNCPVYNAMKAAGVPVLAVHFARWVDLNHKYRLLPPNVAEWIWKYDNPAFVGTVALTPGPIEFDLSWEG